MLLATAVACSAGSPRSSVEVEEDNSRTIDPGKLKPVTGSSVNCGDGILQTEEACDDGNEEDGDGCAASCLALDPGYICATPGEPCQPFAKCGDGVILSPIEQCDDENITAGDGCSPNCKIEIGYDCSGIPSTCAPAQCGDGEVNGAEGCDDGNAMPFDGCDQNCQWEPVCSASGCSSSCGDGIVLGDEECDDSNSVDGDGCSSDCKVELGYECTAECDKVGDSCVLRVPTVFRDFAAYWPGVQTTESGRDFELCDNAEECYDQLVTGLVESELDEEGKPVLVESPPQVTHNGVQKDVITSPESFYGWYRDVDGVNMTVVGEVVLFDNGKNGYVNRYTDTGGQYEGLDGDPAFFPLDGLSPSMDGRTFAAKIPWPYDGTWPAAGNHNFHFTSEVTYWFIYDAKANALLEFNGDDDVWVFVNGKLAVDLGGVHAPNEGSVVLGAAAATSFGLEDGKVYEIKVFHAERQSTSSTFKLTLSNFNTARSECLAVCGDGIIGAGEECDDGVNDGGYNECQPGCVLGGYCGDGIKQESEQCDDRDPAAQDCVGCRMIVVR